MSEHKPSYKVQETVCRPTTQDCIVVQICGRVQKKSAALNILMSTVASNIR